MNGQFIKVCEAARRVGLWRRGICFYCENQWIWPDVDAATIVTNDYGEECYVTQYHEKADCPLWNLEQEMDKYASRQK